MMRGKNFSRVAVLMGGPSSEREVSLSSGKAVAQGLRQAGYEVSEVDLVDRNLNIPDGVEGVFIALHGAYGEDGQVQAQLDERRIPYTGSGALAGKLSFDKACTKEMLVKESLCTPDFELLREGEMRTLALPVVTKPLCQGSSIGVHRVFSEEDWGEAIANTLSFGGVALVEEYIPGRELTVGIVGDQILPVIEIHAPGGWYSYNAKYTKGRTEYLVPAPIDETVARTCQQQAWETYKGFGCRGFARVDLRMSEDQGIYILELNSIPGFTETSLLPKAAAEAGISFSELCNQIMDSATYD